MVRRTSGEWWRNAKQKKKQLKVICFRQTTTDHNSIFNVCRVKMEFGVRLANFIHRWTSTEWFLLRQISLVIYHLNGGTHLLSVIGREHARSALTRTSRSILWQPYDAKRSEDNCFDKMISERQMHGTKRVAHRCTLVQGIWHMNSTSVRLYWVWLYGIYVIVWERARMQSNSHVEVGARVSFYSHFLTFSLTNQYVSMPDDMCSPVYWHKFTLKYGKGMAWLPITYHSAH